MGNAFSFLADCLHDNHSPAGATKFNFLARTAKFTWGTL
jgi:hypothetical protein